MTDTLQTENAFEHDKPGTMARDRAEAAIEVVRRRGGVFVEAVRATRMAMALTDPALPGNPIIFANQSFLDISGYALEEVLGQQPYFMNGPDTDPEDAERFRHILEEDRDGLIETVQYAKDGRRFVATVLLTAFKNEDGATLHHFLSWSDVTRRVDAEESAAKLRQAQAALHESERRQAFLLELGDALRAQSGADDMIEVAARLLGEHLNATRVMFAEFEEAHGVADIFHGWYADGAAPFPTMLRLADHEGPVLADLRAGRIVQIDDTRDPALARPDLAAIAQVGVGALISVPLIVDGRLVVNLSVHQDTARVWTEDETALVRDVAERLWADLVRARAAAALRESEERQAFLLRLSDALRPLTDAEEIQAITARLLGQLLDVDRAMYAEVSGDPGTEVGVIRGQYVRPAAPGRPSPAPFPDHFTYETFGAEVMARRYSGEGLAVADVNADPGFDATERAAWASAGVQAAIVVPLVKGGRLVAELGVHSGTAREWTDAELSLVREVGERTWAAAERARAESALRTSEQRYHDLFRSMDEAYAVVDVLKDEAGTWADFRLVEVNPAFMHHTGITDPVGRTATELLGTPNPRWAQIYGHVLDTGEPMRVQESEWTLGRTFDLNIFCLEPVLNRVAVLFSDITERKAAEAALRESEEKYRRLFDTIDSGYALTDNVRDEEGQVVDLFGVEFNRNYTHHSGLPPFAGLRASEVITVQPEWLQQFEEVTRTGVPVRHENYIVERDRWVSTHYSLVGDLGSDRVAVVFDDITDRKRAEAALRESEERQAFLLKLSDALRPLSDPVAIQEVAARLTAEHLDIGRIAYCEVRQEPEPTAVIERDWPRRDLPSMAGRHRIADFGAFLGKELPAGRPVVVSDASTDPRLSDTERGHWASLGVVASYNVPIIKDGRVAAYLVAHDNVLHHWTKSEIAILREVAERTWASVERAAAEAALRESEERYAALFAASPAPVLILRPDAPHFTIADVNDAYLAATMRTHEDLVGRAMFDAFPDNPDDPAANGVSALRASLERALVSPRFEPMEVQKYDIVRPDGTFEERWWKPANSPVVDDDGNVMAIIHHVGDVTAEHRAVEALRASEERLRTLMEGIPQLVWRSCDEGRWTWSSPQWQAFTGQGSKESLALGWLEAVHPDDREITMRAWEAARPHGMLDVEYRVRRAADGAYLWHHTRSLPVRDDGGRVLEWLGTTTDVQVLKELQERQSVLVAELQHRTRNLIAVVRSIARQTMAQTGPTETFRDEFSHRMEALARVQGLLSRSDEEPITMEALIRMELDALGVATAADRITLAGPPARIRHSAVQTLALALHELATNARKYGALSAEGGRLSIEWQVRDAEDGEPWLSLDWIEHGATAPAEANPARRGYGRELIEEALPYSLGARTRYDLGPDGARCTIELPLERRERHRAA